MTTALIDGDVLIFRAAAQAERVFDWGEDLWTIAADLNEAKQHLDGMVREIQDSLRAVDVVMAVSDRRNFRKSIDPAYKSNRRERKPLVFYALRDWAVSERGAVRMPSLEGDDVLGIEATSGYLADPVVVTIDKDLKGIPGHHYNPDKPERGVYYVSEAEAFQWHLIQTMAGDAADGYSGIPGIGPVKALRRLEKDGCSWQTVVSAYADAGLSEEEAMRNARLAKILTIDEWDSEKREVKLWEPKGAVCK